MTTIDLGNYFAQALLQGATSSVAAFGLDTPAVIEQVAGSALPIADCCAGILWTRVDTVYPTDGDGQPFQPARNDFDVPAWTFPIQVGWLGCHTNITADGGFVDATDETGNATRDGLYRAAIMDAVYCRLPESAAPWLLGYRLSPWTPYGPDGMCSGGMMIVYCITNQLVISE